LGSAGLRRGRSRWKLGGCISIPPNRSRRKSKWAFHGGSISQWIRSVPGGEQLPPAPLIERARLLPPINFASRHEGSVNWQVTCCHVNRRLQSPRRTNGKRRSGRAPALPAAKPGAWIERRGGGFIFYRGLGKLRAAAAYNEADATGRLLLKNTAVPAFPSFGFSNRRPPFDRSDAMIWWHGPLEAGEERP